MTTASAILPLALRSFQFGNCKSSSILDESHRVSGAALDSSRPTFDLPVFAREDTTSVSARLGYGDNLGELWIFERVTCICLIKLACEACPREICKCGGRLTVPRLPAPTTTIVTGLAVRPLLCGAEAMFRLSIDRPTRCFNHLQILSGRRQSASNEAHDNV